MIYALLSEYKSMQKIPIEETSKNPAEKLSNNRNDG
jgi:hypothetical protein